jgi:hypothetical protein
MATVDHESLPNVQVKLRAKGATLAPLDHQLQAA